MLSRRQFIGTLAGGVASTVAHNIPTLAQENTEQRVDASGRTLEQVQEINPKVDELIFLRYRNDDEFDWASDLYIEHPSVFENENIRVVTDLRIIRNRVNDDSPPWVFAEMNGNTTRDILNIIKESKLGFSVDHVFFDDKRNNASAQVALNDSQIVNIPLGVYLPEKMNINFYRDPLSQVFMAHVLAHEFVHVHQNREFYVSPDNGINTHVKETLAHLMSGIILEKYLDNVTKFYEIVPGLIDENRIDQIKNVLGLNFPGFVFASILRDTFPERFSIDNLTAEIPLGLDGYTYGRFVLGDYFNQNNWELNDLFNFQEWLFQPDFYQKIRQGAYYTDYIKLFNQYFSNSTLPNQLKLNEKDFWEVSHKQVYQSYLDNEMELEGTHSISAESGRMLFDPTVFFNEIGTNHFSVIGVMPRSEGGVPINSIGLIPNWHFHITPGHRIVSNRIHIEYYYNGNYFSLEPGESHIIEEPGIISLIGLDDNRPDAILFIRKEQES